MNTLETQQPFIPLPIKTETSEVGVYIAGAGGCLGVDLAAAATSHGLKILDAPEHANFVALCTPSHISQVLLDNKSYDGKVVIDMSGAAKQSKLGQYGLMTTRYFDEEGIPVAVSEPVDPRFDPTENVYGNPGCIASATIRGLGAAGLLNNAVPQELSIFSVGGQSHAHEVGKGAIKLARRLNTHPHVAEIERHFDHNLTVSSFMPTACDVPYGLLVAIHGKTPYSASLDLGQEQLSLSSVLGTDRLAHRLEVPDTEKVEGELVNFSLAVAIDNLRFVTSNAVKLIQHLSEHRR